LDSDSYFKTDELKDIAKYSYFSRMFAYLSGLAVVLIVLNTGDSNYQENIWLMSFLFIVCLTWPHIAYLWAKKSNQVHKAITNSLLFDSFFYGLWVPLMSFEIIPCSVFITVLMVNNISAGGLKLFIRGLITTILAIVFSSLIIKPSIQFESNIIVIFACIPMMTIYPMVFAAINYKLTSLLILQRGKLIHLSRHDSLTGVFSRRYWEQRLLEEFNRCQRSGEDACVMMLDLDHFKKINDTYGHLAGDNVLKEVGELLNKLRTSDISGRYGGEEFAVLLPNSNLQESLLVAERFRQQIEGTQFGDVSGCTISIGVASLQKNDNDAYKWLDHADQALYEAKKEGRNRVNTWVNTEA
jgi:diguanylate cyclase